MEKEYSIEVGGRPLTFKFLNWAEQANGSVLVSYGDTTVLTTVVMGHDDREGLDYFPLTVEYRERYYAAGEIGGGRFNRREGRPSDEATLKARMIDRTLRPLFDQRIRREIQVVNTVLSYDANNTPDVIALVASSVVLLVSDIPWAGPVAAVRVSKDENNWALNVSSESQEKSILNVLVAGTRDSINMLEADAREAVEKDMLEAVSFGHQFVVKLIEFQEKIQKEIGRDKQKLELHEAPDELKKEVREMAEVKLKEAFRSKQDHMAIVGETREKLTKKYGEEYPENIAYGIEYLDKLTDGVVHELALKENTRVDGRKMDEIRPLSGQIALLARTHGSGLFMRGQTHALSAVTLRAPGEEELSDDMEGEEKKRFMHHYNFPPFATGEAAPFRGPGRREIGHGALAEKALAPLIPDIEIFPYVIRIVSEILSSNGSSSMASVCGSSLALMDAGVPIKKHIAGIAMGLMSDGKDSYKVLTDIQGPEDHHGDMDLKIAGTKDGITAMQMDIKIDGITLRILEDALKQAKTAREKIIEVLEGAVAKPRPELSQYAPSISAIKIDPKRIGDVIGPGGRVIREIIEETGVDTIDVEDDGRVFIAGHDKEKVEQAVKWVEALTHEVKVGEMFNAKVVKIADFGAFVELTPGQEALVHVSELSNEYVKDVSDVVKVGDRIEVKVIKIDESGKIGASAKQLKKTNGK